MLKEYMIETKGYAIAVKYSKEEFPEENALAEANLRHEIMSERVKSQTSVIITNVSNVDFATEKHRPNLGLIVIVEDVPWEDNGKHKDEIEWKPISLSVAHAKRGKLYMQNGGILNFEMPGETETEQIAYLLRKICQARERKDSFVEVIVDEMTDEMMMVVLLISADYENFDVVLRCKDAIFAPKLLYDAAEKLDIVYRHMYVSGTERVKYLEKTSGVVTVPEVFPFHKMEKAESATELAEFAKKLIHLPVSGNIRIPDVEGQSVSSHVLRSKHGSETNQIWRFWIDCDSANKNPIESYPRTSKTKGGVPSNMTPSSVYDPDAILLRIAAMLFWAGILSAKDRVEKYVLDDYMYMYGSGDLNYSLGKKPPVRLAGKLIPRLTPPDMSVFLRVPNTLIKTLRIGSENLKVTIPAPILVTGTPYLIFPICWLGRYGDERDFEMTFQDKDQRRMKKFFLCDRVFALGERTLSLVVDTSQYPIDEEGIDFICKSWLRDRTTYAEEEMITAEDVRKIDLRFMMSYSSGAATDFHEASVEKNTALFSDVSLAFSDEEIIEFVIDPWIAKCVMSRMSKDIYKTYFRSRIGLFEFEGREPLPLPFVDYQKNIKETDKSTAKLTDSSTVSKSSNSPGNTKNVTEPTDKPERAVNSGQKNPYNENKPTIPMSYPSHPYYQYLTPTLYSVTRAAGLDTLPFLLIDQVVKDWNGNPNLVFEALKNLPYLNEIDWHFPVTQGMKAELIRKTFWIVLPTKRLAEDYARYAEERLRTKSNFIRIGSVGVVLVLPEHYTIKLGYEKEY